MRPPRLRCTLFPLIHLPHLLVLPATFGLYRLLPTYPYFPALYVVPVRQAKGLPTASFRFHLTMNTLAVQLYTSLLPRCIRDFHPLERAHGAQTQNRYVLCISVFYFSLFLIFILSILQIPYYLLSTLNSSYPLSISTPIIPSISILIPLSITMIFSTSSIFFTTPISVK